MRSSVLNLIVGQTLTNARIKIESNFDDEFLSKTLLKCWYAII